MSRTYTYGRRIIAIIEMDQRFYVPDGRDQREQTNVEYSNLEFQRESLADVLKHTGWSVDHVKYGGVVPTIGDAPTVVFADRVTGERVTSDG